MTTGTEKLIVKSKRLVGVSDFADRIVGYLNGRIDEMAEHTFSAPATFGQISLLHSGVNKYKLSLLGANSKGKCTDGLGNMIQASQSETVADIAFPNVSGTYYYVGLKRCTVPSGVRTNPRTKRQEYLGEKDELGVTGSPWKVEDNGDGTYTFNIQTMLPGGEAGWDEDYTGRTAKLYLVDIADDVSNEAEAIVDVVITNGSKLTTDKTLGQSVVSLVGSKYMVTVLGPSTTTNQTYASTDGHVYVGRITGNASNPVAFDYGDQPVVLTPSWSDMLLNGAEDDLNPASSNSYDLGSSSYYWARLYVGQMFYKTAATTFDNLNDLDLIEAYTPSGEYVDKTKGGELRSVQTAVASSLPWPVLGDVDPSTGEAFIDAGDSVCFLLGAIKQMYQLHKSEVGDMKKTIINLETMVKDSQYVKA